MEHYSPENYTNQIIKAVTAKKVNSDILWVDITKLNILLYRPYLSLKNQIVFIFQTLR